MSKPKLPKSWNDITLEQYGDIYDITQQPPVKGDPFWEVEQNCKVLSVITGEPFDKLYGETPTIEIKHRYRQIAFIATPPSSRPIQKFKLGKFKWFVQYEINKLPASKYIDLRGLTKESENIIYNAPALISIFCTPHRFSWKTFRWVKAEIDDSEKTELLKKCPVSVAYPLTVFFCNLYNSLTEVTEDYLNQQLKQTIREVQEMKAELQATTTNDANGS